MPFIILKYLPCITTFWRVFNHEWMLNFSNTLFHFLFFGCAYNIWNFSWLGGSSYNPSCNPSRSSDNMESLIIRPPRNSSNAFSVYIEKIIWFLPIILLMCCITLIDLRILRTYKWKDRYKNNSYHLFSGHYFRNKNIHSIIPWVWLKKETALFWYSIGLFIFN